MKVVSYRTAYPNAKKPKGSGVRLAGGQNGGNPMLAMMAASTLLPLALPMIRNVIGNITGQGRKKKRPQKRH